MRTGLRNVESELQSTACRRYDRVSELVSTLAPTDAAQCLTYLSDTKVRMGITVQQMVFQASSGLCLVR